MTLAAPSPDQGKTKDFVKAREDFPVSSFTYLAGLIKEIRKQWMQAAADLALNESEGAPVFRVESDHIDRAARVLGLDHFLGKPAPQPEDVLLAGIEGVSVPTD